MTKNDITRGLIDFAVSQCLKNIKEDPYRSIRRLADLGRQFAKGRFQEELFSLFQRLLLNEDGPYYEMLKQLVSSVDTDSLKTLGINIGYNSWTCGASRLRQITAEKDYPHWLAEISLSPESSASTSGVIPFLLMSLPFGVKYFAMVIFTALPSVRGWMVCTTPFP